MHNDVLKALNAMYNAEFESKYQILFTQSNVPGHEDIDVNKMQMIFDELVLSGCVVPLLKKDTVYYKLNQIKALKEIIQEWKRLRIIRSECQ